MMGARLLALGLVLALLTGCANAADTSGTSGSSSVGASATTSPSASAAAQNAAAQITVRVALYGGPAKPDGTMADNNTPALGVRVTVTGGQPVTTTTELTAGDGTAHFQVTPGPWTVSTSCGAPQVVDAAAGSSAVDIRCYVP